MINNATYLNGKISHYTCTQCNCEYKARFKDTTLCITCLKPIHDDINDKLSEHRKIEHAKTMKFVANYKSKKNKAPVKVRKRR